MNTKFLLLVIALIAYAQFAFVAQAQVIPGCGIPGVIDLSPLNAYELFIRPNASTYNYIIRTCGVVNDSICTNRTVGTSVCQRRETVTDNVYQLSSWNASAVTYYRDQGGLTQILKTGALCGATPRQTTIYYKCDPNATVPQLIFAAETTSCQYAFTILTNLTCIAPSFCNFDGVDLNPMFAAGDLTFTSGNFRWYIHMCSTNVSNLLCANDTTSKASMVCQQRADNSDSFGIAKYDASTLRWESVPTGNNAGLLITVPNGEYCSAITANRTARLQLVCNRALAANASYISGIAEVTTCVYQITIMTSLTCSVVPIVSSSSSSSSTGLGVSSWWPESTSCVYNGVDFSSLFSGSDLTFGGFDGNTYYNYSFHMCGVVRNQQCLSDATTYNSMLCQSSITNPLDNFALDYFLPSYHNWTNTTYGVQYTSTQGERCTNGMYRSLTVDFQCESSASIAYISSLVSATNCTYFMIVKTSLVCTGTNQPPSSTGMQPQVPDCVFNGMDFKTINPAQGDLSLTSGFYYYFRVCARVNNFVCQTDVTAQSASLCQTRLSGSASFSLGDSNPINQQWFEYSGNSTVRLVLGGGEQCPNGVLRTTFVDFVCNRTFGATNGIYSIVETQTCIYNMIVVANDLICPHFNIGNSSSTGDNVVVSSSSGSTIVASSSSSSAAIAASSSSSSAAIAASSSSAAIASSTGSSMSSSGTQVGCVTSPDSIPANYVPIAVVFNATVARLPSNITDIFFKAIQLQFGYEPQEIAQFRCGTVSAGTTSVVSNVIDANTDQTVVTFYVPTYISASLVPALDSTYALNNRLVQVYPLFPANTYTNQVASCPEGYFITDNGECRAPSAGDDSDSGLSDGAIAGIVVGSVVGGLLLLALIACIIVRGRKSSSSEGSTKPSNVQMA